MPRVRHLVSFVATLILASGCMALRPADPAANLTGQQIEVDFAGPRELEARTRSGTRIVLPDIRAVRGRPLEIRTDTLVLEISWWLRSASWQASRRRPSRRSGCGTQQLASAGAGCLQDARWR
jgi:hypothetical protein